MAEKDPNDQEKKAEETTGDAGTTEGEGDQGEKTETE